MVFSLLALPAAAADDPSLEAAGLLHSLGLFMGVGDIDGVPQFALERPAARVEALVVMLRLFEKSAKAESYKGACPFADVI